MNRFKELRKKFGYSQKQVAELLFVNQTAVSQWERGATRPGPELLLKLSELYHTTTDYLLGRDTSPEGEVFALSSETDYSDLPPEAIEEIEQFKEFVRAKYAKKSK
jgi:transcriptional regulator with XRE-family HTH domain